MVPIRGSLLLFLLLVGISALPAANLVQNGGFEDGLSSWTNLSGGTAVADYSLETATPHAGQNALKVTLTQAGSNAWDAQSLGPTLELSSGIDYTLTFFARAAEAGTNVRIVIQNSVYTSRDFELTTEWAEYSWPFTAEETAPQLRMHHIDSGVYWLDDFIIEGEGTVIEPVTLIVDPYTRHQTMMGFGGALTWYSERVISSPYKDEISALLFEDLGGDIVRFKNWYYPVNYPDNKDPAGDAGIAFTKELFQLARSADPEVKVLVSSWSPPAGLKSNGNQRQGTLKKEDGAFVYDAFAQYWVDSLDHLGFEPDYISIQNEPGYINPGWDTCEWRPTETPDYPSYTIAFDRVHDRIKDRPNAPLMIGPEAENVGSVSWGGNTFEEFTDPLVGKDYLAAYAYHLYNFNSAAAMDNDRRLHAIRDKYTDRPNLMTEFSKNTMDWLDAALAIHHTVNEANAAGYIYWELVWDAGSPSAAIGIDGSGNYTVGLHYYALKHYSKFIDPQYQRLEVAGQTGNLRSTSYLSPDGNTIVSVMINRGTEDQEVTLDLGVASAIGRETYQTTESSPFVQLPAGDSLASMVLPPRSLTTVVHTLEAAMPAVLPVEVIGFQLESEQARFEVANRFGARFELRKNNRLTDDAWYEVPNTIVNRGLVMTTIVDPTPGETPLFYEVLAVD